MNVSVLFALLAISSLDAISAQVTMRWFNVPVCHYNPLIRRSFDLRYYANDQHYVPGGPIFIYVGGGNEVYDDYLARGAVFEIAQETGGYLFGLEHRFFGASRPTDDTSVDNLAFLTVHQAVADIGDFIAFVKANYRQTSESRVVLWGRGYGGALAVWARHKYHHLVDGVWASSAFVNAVSETQQFMRNTAYTIRSIGGPACNQVLVDAFAMMEDAVRTRNTSYVEQRLKLCSPIDLDLEEDISRFFFGIASDIGYEFVSHARYPEIDDKCTIMRGLDNPDNPAENALDAFARWFADDFFRYATCINYNNTAVLEIYQSIEWNSISTITGYRQSLWLQCTQLGQFATSGTGDGHPFGSRFDISFFRRWCAEVFDRDL